GRRLARYCRLLATELTDLERQYLHQTDCQGDAKELVGALDRAVDGGGRRDLLRCRAPRFSCFFAMARWSASVLVYDRGIRRRRPTILRLKLKDTSRPLPSPHKLTLFVV